MKKAYLTLLAVLTNILLFAQEKSTQVDVDINKSSSNWYASPWVWIVGAAVFILLLVALVRGGKSGDSVSVTRTTTTERNDV